MIEALQLAISLNSSDPVIHRTVLVKKDTSFFELHHIIQIAMGWQNYHLFEFNLDGYRVGLIEDDEKPNGFGSDQVLDASKTQLQDILSLDGDSFTYTYDLGDCWLHEITVSTAKQPDAKMALPVCIDGMLNCPPEDCGGIDGFYRIAGILTDKKHPEYKEVKQWVGKKYDPALFDRDKVNKQLKQLKKYIARWNSPG